MKISGLEYGWKYSIGAESFKQTYFFMARLRFCEAIKQLAVI